MSFSWVATESLRQNTKLPSATARAYGPPRCARHPSCSRALDTPQALEPLHVWQPLPRTPFPLIHGELLLSQHCSPSLELSWPLPLSRVGCRLHLPHSTSIILPSYFLHQILSHSRPRVASCFPLLSHQYQVERMPKSAWRTTQRGERAYWKSHPNLVSSPAGSLTFLDAPGTVIDLVKPT